MNAYPTIHTDKYGLHDETYTSHGNNCPYMDIYTWITTTDNNYIPYNYPTSNKNTHKSNYKKNTFELRKQQKLLKLITNKLKRQRLTKYSQF
jgi:hypothetical protein